MNKTLFLPIFILLISVFTLSEAFGEEEDNCQFDAHLEKSWIKFGERPWVTGGVIGCDVTEYHEKNTVYVRILDINGDLLGDTWQPRKQTVHTSKVSPSLYTFNERVYREGSFTGNANVEKVEVIHLKYNQYFFYLPQINGLDFKHRGVYTIELRYGEEIRTINFATLHPDLRYDEEIREFCIDSAKRIQYITNATKVIGDNLFRYEHKPLLHQAHMDKIDEMNKDLIEIKNTC